MIPESAGSTSAGFHLLSPMSRNLFNRVILQSASPLSPWGLITPKEAKRRSVMLAKKLGCPVQNGVELHRDTLKVRIFDYSLLTCMLANNSFQMKFVWGKLTSSSNSPTSKQLFLSSIFTKPGNKSQKTIVCFQTLMITKAE